IEGTLMSLRSVGDALFAVSATAQDRRQVTRIDLASGEFKSESVESPPDEQELVTDPVAAAAAPTAAYLADQELSSEEPGKRMITKSFTQIIPAGENVVQMQVKLIKENMTAAQAIKNGAPMAVNAETRAGSLEGEGVRGAAANGVFNQLKRSRTGGLKA